MTKKVSLSLVFAFLFFQLSSASIISYSTNILNDTTLTERPTASVRGGFHSGTFQVTLSSETSNAKIYYTLDHSTPSQNSERYSEPITISEFTTLRAIAYSDNCPPSLIQTETYIYDVEHAFPIVAYTADPDDFDDMYLVDVDEDVEIDVNVELYETDGTMGFNQQVESEINGGGPKDQKSLALKAKNRLGGSTIDYKIYADSKIDEYRSLILRNSGQEGRKTVFRDAMASSLMRDVSDLNDGPGRTIKKPEYYGQNYRPTVTYINGEYWGIYNLRERMDRRYIEVHFDLEQDEIDFIESKDDVREGDIIAWESLFEYLEDNSLSSDENYQIVADQIDVDNFIDYISMNVYIDNSDWPHKNSRRFRERVEGSKWKFLSYDLDYSFGLSVEGESFNSGSNKGESLERLLTESGENPAPADRTLLFRRLMENEGFMTEFSNRMADQLNVLFNDERVITRIDEFQTLLLPEIDEHTERWMGGLSKWDENVELLRGFARGRADIVRDHFVSEISEIRGVGEITINIQEEGTGEVDINTITVRNANAPFTGKYFEGLEIPVAAFPARGYLFDKWSDGLSGNEPAKILEFDGNTTITANFVRGSTASDDIVINEINYNSPDTPNSDDWVELYNPNNYSVDISGWYFEDESGEFFGMPANTILPADGYLVLVETADKFMTVYPSVNNFIGEFGKTRRGFVLSGKGERLSLNNANGLLIDEVTYSDDAPWPVAADGDGETLQLTNADLDNELVSSWLALSPTPGGPNGEINGIQNQVIDFPTISDQLTTGDSFEITATATSQLAVTFTIASGPATISGNTISLTGEAGTVVVEANQSGNANWNPAPSVTQNFEVREETAMALDQTINFPTIPDQLTTGSSFSITATSTSQLAVTFTIVSGPATISSNTISLTGEVGIVVVEANQSGNANWNAAPSVTQSFDVREEIETVLDQAIDFPIISNQLTTGGPFVITATATSQLAVTFTIISGPATISGNTISLTGEAGTVVVEANQSGNANWNPAPNVTQNFNVFSVEESEDYCETDSDFPWHEWIERVELNDLDHESRKDGYGDYTDEIANLTNGSSYPIRLTAGFSWETLDQYFSVWIDYNQDNNFDPSEQVFSDILADVPNGTDNGSVSGTINIPSTASAGRTRMRIAMQPGNYASSCDILDFGEIEDYTIIINTNSGFSADNSNVIETNAFSYSKRKETISTQQIHLFPNPSKGIFNLNVETSSTISAQISIYDLGGKLMLSPQRILLGKQTQPVDCQQLDNGLYFVKINLGDQIICKKILINR